MQVPETPTEVQDLDLMKRLDAYASSLATYLPADAPIGSKAAQACRTLHTGLVDLVTKVINPILDRTTAREMEMFTMHDHTHGLKVAHLMWHILPAGRQDTLTPPEIGLMVASAFIHDLGMSLTREERRERLAPSSKLWDRLEGQDAQKTGMEKLRAKSSDPRISEEERMRARHRLTEAEEALLTQDTRERHATRERYGEVLEMLRQFHVKDPERIPSIDSILTFYGDSFQAKLVDVCVSHNQDAISLVENVIDRYSRSRFPRDYPVGSSQANLHMIAACLRLADILDFDRERTPAVLFHYLLPANLSPGEHRSVLAWSKHLSISNWHIDNDSVVFRGRCTSHVVHHAIVLFCGAIQEEIEKTRATFGLLDKVDWPFVLPSHVKPDIEAEGYTYVPYRFELDDERVYELLMGGAIYENPLVALRELVQNAVDACKLRDAKILMDEADTIPGKLDRIIIRYEEPNENCPVPKLMVRDKGTGMDELIIGSYFLKVGRSYYNSPEFNMTRARLRKQGVDFAPVSEFGIGFLSTFLLADEVEVDTAPFQAIHGEDVRRRRLYINGPTRLIRLEEPANSEEQLKGSIITLYLTRGSKESKLSPPSWDEVVGYLKMVCQDLPYRLTLQHISGNGVQETDHIETDWPKQPTAEVPPSLVPYAYRIPVNDGEAGLEGEIVLINSYRYYKDIKSRREATFESGRGMIDVLEQDIAQLELLTDPFMFELRHSSEWSTMLTWFSRRMALIRGGFRIGSIHGLPNPVMARLRFTWEGRANRRFLSPNLARSTVSDNEQVSLDALRILLLHLIEHRDDLPTGLLYSLTGISSLDARLYNSKQYMWLQEYSAFTLYQLARQAWILNFGEEPNTLLSWENGTGDSIPFGTKHYTELYRLILNIILPKIAELQIRFTSSDEHILYWQVPKLGWEDILRESYDYIITAMRQRMFAEYLDVEKVRLYDKRSPYFWNSRYSDRLSDFTDDEVLEIMGLLDRVINALEDERPITMLSSEIALYSRLRDVAGELEFGSEVGSWRIDSIDLSS